MLRLDLFILPLAVLASSASEASGFAAQFCCFTQCGRQLAKMPLLFQIADAFKLFNRSLHNFIQIGRFTVYNAVNIIAHFFNNTHIFNSISALRQVPINERKSIMLLPSFM